MSEKKFEQSAEAEIDDGQSSLKRALIIFAVIEALVLIPFVLYRIFR